MKGQKNITLIRRFFEEQANKDDTSRYEEFLSPHVLVHGPASGQKLKGIKDSQKIDNSYIRSYPQKKFIIEELLSFDDRVFVRWICRGKHKGKYKGIHPKNPEFSIAGFSIYRIEKGKIVEIWQFWDRLGLLEQIGEISVRSDLIEPGYYIELLKSFGIEKYVDQAPFLSIRERQCLRSLVEGKTAKETAAIYNLSTRTIESYFENIKKKLKCPTKRDLFEAAQILDKLELL